VQLNLYNERVQKLQKEFKAIYVKKANKWQFKPHQQAIYDFVMKSMRSITFCVNDYTITLKEGNENFGFKHIILRHYGDGCPGEIKALDILNIGNIISKQINIPSKKEDRINFIQHKNNEKYTVVLTIKKPNNLIFTFFSSL
jgi:hypothetical protein